MPTSRASGNQIEDTTNALLTELAFATQNSVLKFPIGTESQRPSNPAVGMLRFNTTNDRPEQYMNVASNNQPGWKEIKGGGGTDFDCVFNYLKAEAIDPKRLVMFTDGYPWDSWGDANYCDTVFIIHGDKNPNPPFGTWALYEDES